MKTTTLIIGALLIGGGLYLYSQHEEAAKTGPSLESKANLALASESNPYTLEALSQQCDANGLHTLAGLLHQKSQAILAFQKPMTGPPPEEHPANSILAVAAGSSMAVAPATLSLAQAVLGAATQGASLDPNTGDSVDTGPGVRAPKYRH